MKDPGTIRILDFSWLLPGPYATMLLADLGADVIKIEQHKTGDYARATLPDMFAVVNRNKRSMTLDLKTDEGRAVVRRLVADADVVVEGFRPGVMKRLGLGHETLMAINPRLIYCSISGYGQDGPYRDWPGHDIAYLGVGGGLSIAGDLKHPPVKGSLPVADLVAAMFAAVSIQGALWQRLSSNVGQYLDLSITDCVAAWSGVRLANVLWNGEAPPNRLSATSRVYEAADGKRISLAVTEDAFWKNLCDALEKPEWLADPRYETLEGRREHALELLPQLERELLRKPRAEWLALFGEKGVPAGPVHDAEDVFDDPQLVHRDLLWKAPGENSGARRMPAYPVKFEHSQPMLRKLAPELGEDSVSVLQEAGYTNEEIAVFKTRLVI